MRSRTISPTSALIILGIVLMMSLIPTSHGCPEKCDCSEPGSVGCIGVNTFPDPAEILEGTAEIKIINSFIDRIENLPDYGSSLENLIVVNSGVREIEDGAFSRLTGLKTLMLNGNKIMEITAAKFSGLGESLVELDLGDNLIQVLPNGLLNTLPSLLRLDLNSNHKLKLEEDCFIGSKVVALALASCDLGMVDTGIFAKANSVVELNLNHNPLTRLTEDNFQGMEKLQKLYLADCGLQEIHEDAFDDLKELQVLDLSFNHLTELDKDVLHDIEDTLKTLRLNHNNLTTLHHDFAEIQSLSVADNPWHCTCGIGWMQEITLEGEDTPICSTPVEVVGHSVVNVTSELECPCGYDSCEGKSNLALYIVIPVVIVLLLLIAFFIYMIVKNRREKAKRKSVKYSAVYKDTVEAANKPV